VSLVVVSLGAVAFAFGGGGGTEPLDPPPPPANTEFAGVLLRVGLGGEALAAAGVSGQQVSGLVAAVAQHFDPATMRARDETFISARQTHDQLVRLIQSGKGTQEDVAARSTAQAALTAAASARDGYLSAAREAGLATLAAEPAALVRRILANQKWGLPTQYLAKDRTEPEWVALRDLVAAKRISVQEEDEPMSEATVQALAAADAVSEVATAKVNLDSGIASVQTAWNAAASQ
jgi:hypothetical protein